MSGTFTKEDAKKQWEKKHPGELDPKPRSKNTLALKVSKEMVIKLIENFSSMRNVELAKLVGLEEHQINMVLVYLRKAGIHFPPKDEQGLKSKIGSIVAELKKDGLIHN